MAPKLLITGATGFLGSHILRAARGLWHPVGTYHRTSRHQAQQFFAGIDSGSVDSGSVDSGSVDSGRIDLGDFGETKEMMAAVRPAAVIHTAAIADPEFCEQHPQDSLRMNFQAAVNLAGLCGDRDIPFIFTSTDLVFDGTKAPYREADPVTPLNVYGEHKAMAEEAILARHEQAAICRMPLMFGYSVLGRETFFAKMTAAFRAEREMTLFADDIRTPVSGSVAAQGLLRVAGSGFEDDANLGEIERFSGRLHLGGREAVSRYEQGLLVLELLGLDERLAVPISLEDIPFTAARSPNVALDSSRAYELGYDPPPLRKQMARLLGVEEPVRSQ